MTSRPGHFELDTVSEMNGFFQEHALVRYVMRAANEGRTNARDVANLNGASQFLNTQSVELLQMHKKVAAANFRQQIRSHGKHHRYILHMVLIVVCSMLR